MDVVVGSIRSSLQRLSQSARTRLNGPGNLAIGGELSRKRGTSPAGRRTRQVGLQRPDGPRGSICYSVWLTRPIQ